MSQGHGEHDLEGKGDALYDGSAQLQNTESSAEVADESETEVSVASVISDNAEVKKKLKTKTKNKRKKG